MKNKWNKEMIIWGRGFFVGELGESWNSEIKETIKIYEYSKQVLCTRAVQVGS